MKDENDFDYLDPLNDKDIFLNQEASSSINPAFQSFKKIEVPTSSAINTADQEKETVSRNNEISSEESSVISSPSELNTEDAVIDNKPTEININLEKTDTLPNQSVNSSQIDQSNTSSSVSKSILNSINNESVVNTSQISNERNESENPFFYSQMMNELNVTNAASNLSTINPSTINETNTSSNLSSIDQTSIEPVISTDSRTESNSFENNTSQTLNSDNNESSIINDNSTKKSFLSSILEKIGVGGLSKTLNLPKLGSPRDAEQVKLAGSDSNTGRESIVDSEIFSTNNINSLEKIDEVLRNSLASTAELTQAEKTSQALNEIKTELNKTTDTTSMTNVVKSEEGSFSSPTTTSTSPQITSLIETVERSTPEITIDNRTNSSTSSNSIQTQPTRIENTQPVVTTNETNPVTAVQKTAPASSQSTETQREPVQPIVSVDMSGMEQRLKRIELILLNGIEVTMK